MFDILFGYWRKASKCKKLIKRVQCRLKIQKNKRCCIVKQLKEDVAELLKHGHHQNAFERVEQLIMDENMIQVYDILDQFCEFIIINLPYIRRNRDCPNDINEAASTLIFSSARFGEFPELLSVRKVFGERYSQRFVTTALELLPGNLVNNQIKENLYMKKVPDDVKYRCLDEISRSCIQTGPLFLEYKPELLEKQPKKRETEEKNKYMDLSSANRKSWKESCFRAIQDMDPDGELSIKSESSSETSAKLPEEVIYLDDIEEFVSPVRKNGNIQDQRLFMFRSFGVPSNEKTDNIIDINKSFVRSSRKTRKASRKRSRKRSVSQECAKCYGNSTETETSPDFRRKPRHQRGLKNKILVSSSFSLVHNLELSCKCSLEDPCYLCTRDENETMEDNGARTQTLPGTLRAITMPCERPKECTLADNINRSRLFPLGHTSCQHIHPKLPDPCYLCTRDENETMEDNGARTQTLPGPLRAITMPCERPKECTLADNINRSNSFPLGHTPCRHIHPKLPDYDELEAKFVALKRANVQNKQKSSNLEIR